jgi:hypothetical protein
LPIQRSPARSKFDCATNQAYVIWVHLSDIINLLFLAYSHSRKVLEDSYKEKEYQKYGQSLVFQVSV